MGRPACAEVDRNKLPNATFLRISLLGIAKRILKLEGKKETNLCKP